MKKRFFLLALALVLSFALLPAAAVAAEPEASLTLHYQKDGAGFSDLKIEVFRVAQQQPDGSFRLLAPFASYPVNIYGITNQAGWTQVAETLHSYMVADKVAPTRTALTDEKGSVRFSALETGLYFVSEARATAMQGTYVFNRFMIYVPTPQADGSLQYEVEARPKCTEFVPNTQYTITKLWEDAGSESRPEAVTAEIYRDGVLQESVTLSAANNWSYHWYVEHTDLAQWTVAEREVPAGYRVALQYREGHFILVNTLETPPQEDPETGDRFALIPWVLAMSLSGMALILLGTYGLRRRA